MPSTKIKLNNSEASSDEITTSDEYNLTDKVEYKDFVQDNIPEEIIFPEELNRFLREQIRELTAENGTLRRSLSELEEKYENLVKKNSQTEIASQPIIGVGRASEIAASKIVELSKKCREQTAEIEVLKSKSKILEAKLNDLKKNDNAIPPSCGSPNNEGNVRPFTIEDELKNRDEQIKVLQEKLTQTNSKLYESKNTCTSLRQEINKAQKLLCSEIGENVTIASLSSHQRGNNWKGRAEQIQQLQQRVTDLQNKLNEQEGSISKIGNGSASIEKNRSVANLRNLEKERRQKAEDTVNELRRMSVELETSKRKQDAAKARVKVLENELANAKQSIALLNEKRSHDDQLIQALNGQLKAVEDKFREREKEIVSTKERAEKECMKMCSEVNKLRTSNENLQRILDERETEIDLLKNGDKNSHLSMSKTCESRGSTSRSNPGDCNEYVILGIAAEAERERLLELVAVLNRRLDEERFTADNIGETLRNERNKLARLETKLQRLEMERVGMSKVNTGYKPRFTKSISRSGSNEELAKDEMRFKLELLEEECLALKTRLATVQRDKISDLALYKQMLDQARKTFQDAHRGKSNTCGQSTVTI